MSQNISSMTNRQANDVVCEVSCVWINFTRHSTRISLSSEVKLFYELSFFFAICVVFYFHVSLTGQ